MIATKGLAAFVQPRYKNQIFAIVDSKNETNVSKNMKAGEKLLEYYGFEDSVINHLLLIKDISDKKIGKDDIERRADRSFLSRRAFSV